MLSFKITAGGVLADYHGEFGDPALLSERLDAVAGLVSHEFFHVWNVKRLRDAVLGPFDYQKEVPTRLLWFHEGFTDYMDSVIALRAGVLPLDEAFAGWLRKRAAKVIVVISDGNETTGSLLSAAEAAKVAEQARQQAAAQAASSAVGSSTMAARNSGDMASLSSAGVARIQSPFDLAKNGTVIAPSHWCVQTSWPVWRSNARTRPRHAVVSPTRRPAGAIRMVVGTSTLPMKTIPSMKSRRRATRAPWTTSRTRRSERHPAARPSACGTWPWWRKVRRRASAQ